MNDKARLIFIYLWIFTFFMIFRAFFSVFELNPTFIYIGAYLPILYFYGNRLNTWLVLSMVGIVLTVSIQNSFVSEFVASQTYIWIMISLYNLADLLIMYEKTN